MIVARAASEIPSGLAWPVATMGNFDGVHLGHRHLLGRVAEVAGQHGGTTVAITFRPHPVEVVAPDRAPVLISGYDEKLALLEAAGVDMAVELPFDRARSVQTAEQFIEEVFVEALAVRHVVAGPDSRFGQDRRGDVAMLAAAGEAAGFTVETVTALQIAGASVSSSRIRGLIADSGDVAAAAQLLGRPFSLTGTVVDGDKRGRTIGFPTANLELTSHLRPCNGVYAARAHFGDQVADAVVNIGVRPTFGVLGTTVEAHLLDFAGDLYGQTLTLSFVGRVRAEQRFDGVDALVAQITADVVRGRAMLQA